MKKQCKTCSKRRDPKFFDTPRSYTCQLCKIAQKHGKKLERREASSKTWIKRLDKLIGDRVRARGTCEATGRVHKGPLQWAHICSRRYHATRWLENNAFCLCAGCHKFYTDRPIEWEIFVVAMIGEHAYRELKRKALFDEVPDYKQLYNELVAH